MKFAVQIQVLCIAMYHVLKPYLNDGCQFWDYLKCKYCDFSLLIRCNTSMLHNILMGLNWHKC